MKMVVAFILNIFIPGLGSLVLGYWVQGPLQIILTLLAFVLVVTVWLTFFGLLLYVLVWLYALVLWTLRIKRKVSTNQKNEQ
jgi:hypothetical protein